MEHDTALKLGKQSSKVDKLFKLIFLGGARYELGKLKGRRWDIESHW